MALFTFYVFIFDVSISQHGKYCRGSGWIASPRRCQGEGREGSCSKITPSSRPCRTALWLPPFVAAAKELLGSKLSQIHVQLCRIIGRGGASALSSVQLPKSCAF